MDTGTGGNMQHKNPDNFECLTCFNDKNFEIAGIERIAAHDWNVLLRCPYCFTGINYQFYGFAWENKLIRHLKTIIGEHNQKEKPTSYVEFCYKTGKIFRNSHPGGLYEEIPI